MIIFGEDCCKWIAEIVKIRDIRGCLSGDHLWFEGVERLDGIVENNGREFNTGLEWEDATLLLGRDEVRGEEPKDVEEDEEDGD